MIPPSRFSGPHLSSPLLSSVRVNTYLYISSSVYGHHDRHKVILPESRWERPAWWLNVLRLARVVLVFMEPSRRKKSKADSLHSVQPCALVYTCVSSIGFLPLLDLREGNRSLDLLRSDPRKFFSQHRIAIKEVGWLPCPFFGHPLGFVILKYIIDCCRCTWHSLIPAFWVGS